MKMVYSCLCGSLFDASWLCAVIDNSLLPPNISLDCCEYALLIKQATKCRDASTKAGWQKHLDVVHFYAILFDMENIIIYGEYDKL